MLAIWDSDRNHHLYIVGQTGVGKSSLVEVLVRQDIKSTSGFALLDPHGDLAVRVAKHAAPEDGQRAVILDLAGDQLPYAYNPLAYSKPELRPMIASGLLNVFRTMWADAWGPRMEHILRNALLALLDYPSASLPGILRMLSEKPFRYEVLRHVSNEQVLRFWRKEYPKYTYRLQADSIAPIQNKIGALLSDPRLYRFFTSNENSLRLRSIMDEGKFLIINLSKGQLGGDSARLLGGILTTMLALAAFSRADMPEDKRRPFFIYLDEFQNFTTLAVAEMLSELRKYKVGMVMAHQYLNQLTPEIRHAVHGNAGTQIAFRVGAEDAVFLERGFAPQFSRHDLMNLPNHHFYLKLMIDGTPSRPFSGVTIPPDEWRI